MSQDTIFSGGEGDRWFARNRHALGTPEHLATDPALRLIELCAITPKAALEVGASNGYRLAVLRERHGCRAVAVEPSAEAVADGQARYPEVEFYIGAAAALPITKDGQFDLVIAHFMLHWVDRATLFRSVAELDRMVADGGFLLVGHFFPATPERVPYHHLEGDVWTFKQDYSEVFLASGLYSRAAALSFDHASHQIAASVAPADRIQVALLHKSLRDGYPPRARGA